MVEILHLMGLVFLKPVGVLEVLQQARRAVLGQDQRRRAAVVGGQGQAGLMLVVVAQPDIQGMVGMGLPVERVAPDQVVVAAAVALSRM